MPRSHATPLCSPAAWLTMMSPVRSEIAQALALLGTGSVSDIAAIINRPADTLYAHIEKLRRAGIVLEDGVRKHGRHVQALYTMRAIDVQPDFSGASVAVENHVGHRTASTLLRAMDRTVRDAAAARALVTRAERRNISMSYELGRLTPAMFQQLRGHVRAIKNLMDAGKRRRTGTLYLAVSIACPVVRKRGAEGTTTRAPRRNARRPA
jgi:DNA-binding transcriptional ArsR family regulator